MLVTFRAKGKPSPLRSPSRTRLPRRNPGAKMPPMKLLAICFSVAASAVLVNGEARAQTFATSEKANAQLETLTKKIDEQNMKIDALSQQILKLEQQISASRTPGVIIGEATPSPAAPASAAAPAPAAPPSGNAHVVAKGETLTSIAKTHKVGVSELQKFNRIENDRALQIGQTIMIPTPGGASPAASPSSTPNE
jgi:LysM repeat protein